MPHPDHHLHIRKRIHVHHEAYPNPSAWKRTLDRAVMVVAILAPAMTFAQVWEIWSKQSAASTSIWTWGMYFISSIVWMVYGISHKEKPIIISNILYIIGTAMILVGIAIF